MESAVTILRRREAEVWVHDVSAEAFREWVAEATARLANRPVPRRVSLATDEPGRFVADFLAAITFPEPVNVFLGPLPEAPAGETGVTRTRIMIRTGGTGGTRRYAVHTWATLAAAAEGLQAALGRVPLHSVCLLPLAHVSGLMQVVRAFVSGGSIAFIDHRALGGGHFPRVPEHALTSLVPTQLARLLDLPGGIAWLRQFRAVFLGGGPAWEALLAKARSARVPLAPCYGMTETAAQVTMCPPAEFLAGAGGVGRALPHAAIDVVDELTGVSVPSGTPGRIRIRGSSVFHGYHPTDRDNVQELLTNDRGILAAGGRLSVLGRMDAVIITGGEKVDPALVEAAIRATALVDDVAVVGLPDPEWGEAVVAVIVGVPPGGERELDARMRDVLAPPQRPKRWVRADALPRNDAGKINRDALRAIAGSAAG